MSESKPGFERGLLPETLGRVTQLSKLRQEKNPEFRVAAKAVGPFVDEIRIYYPDGKGGVDYIEDASG